MSEKKEEKIVKLDQFRPRDYQRPIIKAIEQDNFKKIIAILPRRAGKDICAFNIAVRQALKKTCIIYYLLPTFSQARRVIWDCIMIDGQKLLDTIPKELVVSFNSSEMKINFINGSILQLAGSDSYNRLVGTNPYAVIFSEYSRADPNAYKFISPILAANNGWVLFISTPFGHNSFYDLWKIAKHNPKYWFAYKLTVNDTMHISKEVIQREVDEGIMSEDLVQQEYYTSFDMGVEGSFYSKILNKMRLNSQLSHVPYDPSYKVYTAWDLGVADATCIVFYQVKGQAVSIIDSYTNVDFGLDHYAKVIHSKDYAYGKHWAPHDIAVREWAAGGVKRIDRARQLGINFSVVPNIPLADGIEAVRALLPRVYIDEKQCSKLIKSLESYRREYDSERKVYKDKPYHDHNSNFCFVGATKIRTNKGLVEIKDIVAGDVVRTPSGYKKVTAIHRRVSNTLCEVSTYYSKFTCTPEHDIFTNHGVVRSDSISYNASLEPYNLVRSWIWKKIYGYFSRELGLKGFKKTILSLKINLPLSLMDSFIDGMKSIILEKNQSITSTSCYIGLFGHSIREKSLKIRPYITKTLIQGIILLKILSLWIGQNIKSFIASCLDHGAALTGVHRYCEKTTTRLKNGTGVLRVENGTVSMLRSRCPLLRGLDIRRYVPFVEKNMKQKSLGKNIVERGVRSKSITLRSLILLNVIVRFVTLYSWLTSILPRKHVVKSVRTYCCDEPVKVYDITVEDDSCYYANNYLVSNCDAVRMLAVSLPQSRDGVSAEELDRRYNEAIYGSSTNLPEIFR